MLPLVHPVEAVASVHVMIWVRKSTLTAVIVPSMLPPVHPAVFEMTAVAALLNGTKVDAKSLRAAVAVVPLFVIVPRPAVLIQLVSGAVSPPPSAMLAARWVESGAPKTVSPYTTPAPMMEVMNGDTCTIPCAVPPCQRMNRPETCGLRYVTF